MPKIWPNVYIHNQPGMYLYKSRRTNKRLHICTAHTLCLTSKQLFLYIYICSYTFCLCTYTSVSYMIKCLWLCSICTLKKKKLGHIKHDGCHLDLLTSGESLKGSVMVGQKMTLQGSRCHSKIVWLSQHLEAIQSNGSRWKIYEHVHVRNAMVVDSHHKCCDQ